MNKRTQDVFDAIKSARAGGWEIYSRSGIRRKTERKTPENIPSRWWSSPTYTECEFIDFIFDQKGNAKSAVFAHFKCPWTERRDQKISIKKAIELLSTPKEDN